MNRFVVRLALILIILTTTFRLSFAVERPGSSVDAQIMAEYAQGKISYDQSLLYRLRAVREPDKLPVRFRSETTAPMLRSATMIFREAFLNFNELAPDIQGEVARLLTRPPATNTYDSPQGWFKLHYDVVGPDAVPGTDSDGNGVPDFIERVAGYCDSVWRTEVINLGYLEPPSDGTAGGDARYDIYFQEIGAYGYTSGESFGPEPWNDATSYIVMHRDFIGFPPNTDPDGNQWGAAKVTIAHEFFHAVQFGYDYTENAWFMELTSTWMEDVVYDTVNDNYNYLSEYFTVPQTAISDESGLHMYGAFVWGKYLEERFDTSLVREIWEGARFTSNLVATNDSLGQYGYTLDEAFAEFETWMFKTGSRNDGSGFSEASNYPLVPFAGFHNSYPTGTITPGTLPQGMAAVYVRFLPGGRTGRFNLTFDGSTVYDWNVYLIASTNATTHQVLSMPVDGSGHGTFSIEDFQTYSEVTMVAVNNKEFTGGGQFTYSADVIQPYGVAVSASDQIGYSSNETTFPLVISNTSALTDTITFALADDFGWSMSPSGGALTLGPDADSTVSVTVTVPQWTAPATIDRIDIAVQSQSEPVIEADTAIDLEILLLHGDANWDGAILIDDAVYLVNHIFKGGISPAPELLAGDADCNGSLNVSDIVYLVNLVFKGGPVPPCNP